MSEHVRLSYVSVAEIVVDERSSPISGSTESASASGADLERRTAWYVQPRGLVAAV